MTHEVVAERLLTEYGKPDFEHLVEQLKPHLTVELIKHLKARVDEEKLKDAHNALRIATLTQSVYPHVADPEAEALAYWAKASALLHLSRYPEALICDRKAATIYSTQKKQLSLVGVQASMVAILRKLGDHHAALQLASKARMNGLALGKAAQRALASLEANVGAIYRQIGNPEAALEAYQRGRHIFAELGDRIEVARIDINRSYVLREMSRFVIAQELLHDARLTLVQTGQHAQQVARVDGNLAMLAYQRGRYQEALNHLEVAREGFVGMAPLIGMIDLRRGLIYRKLNLIPELIEMAIAAGPIFVKNGMFEEQAVALHQQGIGYLLSGAYALAESYLTKARDLYQQQEIRAKVFELDYDIARLTRNINRLNEAWQSALKLEQQVTPDIWPRLAAQVRLLIAQCALKASQAEEAYQYAKTALELASAYSLREITITAHHLMGQILESSKESHKAWIHYQTAMQLIESLRVQLLVDQFRIGFMDDKLPIYEDAIRLSQQAGTPAQVLYTLNLAHTAPLLFKGSGTDPIDSELQQKLAHLREQWHWYQNKLEEASSDKDAATTVATLRPQLNKIEAELAELTRRWQVRHTSNLRPISVRDEEHLETTTVFKLDAADQFLVNIQQNLTPDEALLNYYLIKDRFQALIVTSKAIYILPDLAKAKPLTRILNGWRFHLTQSHLISQALETSCHLAQRYLTRLYQALIASLLPYLGSNTHLFVVIPPGWHDLPLAACFDGQKYLVERYQVTYLSAPEVLLNERSTTSSQATAHTVQSSHKLEGVSDDQALIVAHSDGGRLTGTLQAAQTVADKLQTEWQITLLMNQQATISNFKRASRESHLIHLATHATFRADNPLFSWIRLANHRLTLAELYQMKLPQNPLVVLSACETGKGQARGGGLLGMGRALLAAGASGVVVTLWRVEDQASAELMITFYGQLQSKQAAKGAATALRQAQLQAIAQHQHPFFWAGFIFIQA